MVLSIPTIIITYRQYHKSNTVNLEKRNVNLRFLMATHVEKDNRVQQKVMKQLYKHTYVPKCAKYMYL